MKDKFFVGTNILVYAHDLSAGLKRVRAMELLEQLWLSGSGVLSTQVLQEFRVNLRRKTANPPGIDEIRALLREYSTWKAVINTPDSIVRALDIEHRFKVSFWDAMILQAAHEAGASIVYSEDLSAGQFSAAVRVVNPLVDPAT